jgi:hypothetical protein
MDQLEASALSIIDPATISVTAHSEEFVRFGKRSRDTDVEVSITGPVWVESSLDQDLAFRPI